MMKKLFCCTVLAFCAFFRLTADFIKVPTAEKFTEKDLLFAVTFDKFNLNADFAKGEKRSVTHPEVQLMLRGSLGFDGQQAYRPISGEKLKFDAIGNADPHEGTLSMWYQGIDWAPGTAKTDGKKRGNIVLANLKFTEKSRFIEFRLYQYEDTVYFDWWSSEPPHGFNQYGRVAATIKRVKAKEWVQLTATWKGKKLALYVNGVLANHSVCPGKYEKTADLKPEKGPDTYIGIKYPFYGDQHEWKTEVDDFCIFSRAMTDLEIRNRYLKLKRGGDKEIQAYELTLSGVDTGDGRNADKLEAQMDLSSLPEPQMKLLRAGKLSADWKLQSPSGKITSGKWEFRNASPVRLFKAGFEPGTWKLETKIAGLKPVSASIVQPKLDFIGNRLGEDTVPELWKDFALNEKDRSVRVWNRIIHFGKGPLPDSIRVGARELLEKAPQLLIDGREPVWTPGKISRDAISYTLETVGKIPGGELRCRTRVEFDGLTALGFTVHGKPEIDRMELRWQVKPEFRQFLMTPRLYQKPSGIFEAPFPNAANGARHKQLWLVSEKVGGLVFTMPDDANWRYKPENSVLFANRKTGECRVVPVELKSRIPEGARYRLCFLATPTRPLPVRNRVVRFSDYGTPGAPFWDGCACQGQNGVNTFEPHPEAFEFYMRPLGYRTKAMYGTACSLADDSPVGRYFKKYWDIPGAPDYKMPHRPRGRYGPPATQYNSLPGCTATCYNDYLLFNQQKVYRHPYGGSVGIIYYDLCGNEICANSLHGHGGKDAFGRTMISFTLENKRNLVRRTVAQAHRNGRLVLLHAQRDFNPVLHGMADYWFPGEQHYGLIINSHYGYTDNLEDELWRSEYNRDVLGIGVFFLPVIGYIHNGYLPSSEKYAVAMLTMCQMNDIESCGECIPRGPMWRLWNILEKYGVQDPKVRCIRYYEPGLKVVSSNPDVRVTRYECPEGRHVLFIANREMRARETEVDLSALAPDSFTACEEWQDKPVTVENGKFRIRIPGRSFRIVAFPPKPTFPIRDGMEKMWSIWKTADSDVLFDHIPDLGCAAPPCIRMQVSPSGKGGCFTRGFPAVPGRTYTVRIMARAENADGFSMSLQPAHGMTPLKIPPPIKRFKASKDWTPLEMKFKVPASKKWQDTDRLMMTISGRGKNYTAWFDDWSVDESR
jgi:hypothetical protein